jgi:hypothetical protein
VIYKNEIRNPVSSPPPFYIARCPLSRNVGKTARTKKELVAATLNYPTSLFWKLNDEDFDWREFVDIPRRDNLCLSRNIIKVASPA